MYKFKEIQTVPPADAFIDIVLSRTQRKTPTVVHPGYKITRIRKFYERKIKYAQSSFAEKITWMVQGDNSSGKVGFPKIDDIHPFYADLCNVLYDRDHYKLALGQMNKVKNMIDNIAKDYVRMMKFADSLYRCKMLKRASLGRMCTAVKKLGPTLKYLEEVRQHLARLPSINPATRTIIMTGYPNVGKSSFMNLVTQADVDVQPYAFTTKSLFVGHMDYQYCRWQVIDTPGILDHPLEERNTIEMTAITALAHIPATILFFLDISETCGFTLKQQCALFDSLKPLFRNKPLLVIINKTDLRSMDSLNEEEATLLKNMTNEVGELGGSIAERTISVLPMSCHTKDNVDVVRQKACDLLLTQRVDKKVTSARSEGIKNRIHVSQPTVIRHLSSAAANNSSSAPDGSVTQRIAAQRPVSIPQSVLSMREALDTAKNPEEEKQKKEDILKSLMPEDWKTEKQLQEEMGGAGVYTQDRQAKFLLADEDWKYDAVPEIMDGHNIADFIDEDIMEKLAALEKEEETELAAEKLLDTDEVLADWKELEGELKEVHGAIKYKKMESRIRSTNNTTGHGGTERKRVKKIGEITESLKAAGKDVNEESLRGRSRGRKRLRDEDDESKSVGRSQSRAASIVARHGERSVSKVRGLSIHRSKSRVAQSIPRAADQERAEKKRRVAFRDRNKDARKGEGDRHIPDFKPKHLHTGKRGSGKTDRR